MGRSPHTGPRFYAGATLTRKEVFRYIFWEWIEPIGSALGIALLVMHFVMALYVIPTGSMQPTLHGANDYGTGDKVMVNKFVYRFQEPERWDVIVFDFPYKSIICDRCENDAYYTNLPTLRPVRDFPIDAPEIVPKGVRCLNKSCADLPPDFYFIEKEYIKRCAAVPGDEISVRDGNIVLKKGGVWKTSIKTRDAQEALWVSPFDSDENLAVAAEFWKSNKGGIYSRWKDQSSLSLQQGEDLIFDAENQFLGLGDKNGPSHQDPSGKASLCGDVAIEIEWDGSRKEGQLELDISRNLMSEKLILDFSKRSWLATSGSTELGKGTFDSDLEFLRLERVDGQVQCLFGDKLEAWPIPNFDPHLLTKSIAPKIRYRGVSEFSFERLRILRDIYYVNTGHDFFSGEEQSYKVRSGEYFAMGDNSYFSSDSRDWGPVPAEKLIGKALLVLFPPSRAKFIY